MEKVYDYPTRQASVQTELETLRINMFVARNDISSMSEGFKKSVIKITTFNPQALFSFREDDHKVRCIRCALLHAPCAQLATGQLSSMNFTVNKFLSALRDDLQLYLEGDITISAAIKFQRYGRLPLKNGISRPRNSNHRPTQLDYEPLTLSGNSAVKCFICGKHGHFRQNCPPKNSL